jgi:hypothetical protein
MNVQKTKLRGSERIAAAWKSRALSEDSVKEIVAGLGETRGEVGAVEISGGASASGMRVGISYSGDLVSWCGNDITFWLEWLRKHGGRPKKPRIIINGKPWPDLIEMELEFGHFEAHDVQQLAELGALAELQGIARHAGG